MSKRTVIIEVVRGQGGHVGLYISDEDSGHRIAGSKPWGGGSTIHKFTCDADEVIEQVNEYATETKS